MMRAWAAISAAAVLVALPVSVQQAAGEAAGTVTTVPVADSSAAPISAADLGVALWLGVAVIAVLAAFLVLRHTRVQLDTTVGTPAPAVIPLSSPASPVRSDPLGSVSTLNGR